MKSIISISSFSSAAGAAEGSFKTLIQDVSMESIQFSHLLSFFLSFKGVLPPALVSCQCHYFLHLMKKMHLFENYHCQSKVYLGFLLSSSQIVRTEACPKTSISSHTNRQYSARFFKISLYSVLFQTALVWHSILIRYL